MDTQLVSLVLIGAVTGVTELLKRLKARDWYGALLIACAAAIGGLYGYLGVDGLTVLEGINGGLAAAGVYRVSQAIAGN